METYLAHHGILGMKWGIRRYQNEDGTLTASGQVRYGRKMTSKRRAAARKAAQTKKKAAETKRKEEETKQKVEAKRIADEKAGKHRDVSTMSDQEIRDFLNRKNLERMYLAEITPKTVEKGKSSTEQFFEKFGNTLLTAVATGIAKKLSEALLKSMFGSDDNTTKAQNSKNDDSGNTKKADKDKKEAKERTSFFENSNKSDRKNNFSNSDRENATKRKVYEGVVEDGWKAANNYTEKHKDRVIIDVDWEPVSYRQAENIVNSLPQLNAPMSMLMLPAPK